MMPAEADYVINWFAQIFQFPSIKPGVALIMKGIEGVGKNRLTDLFNLMLGEGHFLETSKPDTCLYGRFTDARRGKFLIVINEAGSKDNHSANDQLKDMITSQTFVWEAKGVDGVQMNCFDRIIFTTNNDNVVKVGSDSRRFVIIDVSSELKGNSEYFTELSRHINSPSGRFAFYKYLMGLDISKVSFKKSSTTHF
jgi:putative DNA primase/helicase